MSQNLSQGDKEVIELLGRMTALQPFWNPSTPKKIENQRFGEQLGENALEVRGEIHKDFFVRDRSEARKANSGFSEVTVDEEKFVLRLDIRPFKIEEIRVSITPDNLLMIKGDQPMRYEDNSECSRSFTRLYCLPKGSITKTIKSSFCDGVLKVIADVEAVASGSPEPRGIRLNLDAYQNYEEPSSEKPENRNVPIVSGELDSSDVVATVKKAFGSLLKMGVGFEDIDKMLQAMKAASLEDASKIV